MAMKQEIYKKDREPKYKKRKKKNKGMKQASS